MLIIQENKKGHRMIWEFGFLYYNLPDNQLLAWLKFVCFEVVKAFNFFNSEALKLFGNIP
jgi:hypothetical protein